MSPTKECYQLFAFHIVSFMYAHVLICMHMCLPFWNQCHFFKKGGATRSLPWPHHLMWTCTLSSTPWEPATARKWQCCSASLLKCTEHCYDFLYFPGLKKYIKIKPPCIPHLYVSTYENTIQKPSCLVSLLLIMWWRIVGMP